MTNMKESLLLGERYKEINSSHVFITGDRAIAREKIIREILPFARMVSVPCLCGKPSAGDISLSLIDRWGLPARSVLCKNCGLIRVDPRWDDETYVQVYQNCFLPFLFGSYELSQERFELSVKRAIPFSDLLKSKINLKGKTVLEIGCSYGAGLFSLKNTGADLSGCDYDIRCLEFGRVNTGFNLFWGGIHEACLKGDQYDVIILRHVLEHFLNPFNELQNLKFLLKEKGVLFVEVPGIFNLKDFGNDPLMYFNVFHTYSFSLRTLTKLMNANSFNCFFGDEKIFSLWEKTKDPFNVDWFDHNLSNKILRFLLELEEEKTNSFNNNSYLMKTIHFLLKKFKISF